jgi:serine/threonine-protein kinase RsbT
MPSPLSALREVLAPHVSAINAGVVIERSRRVLRDANQLLPEDRQGFFFTVSTTLRLFTSAERIAEIIDALEQRLVAESTLSRQELLRFEMRDENDLRTARAATRSTCLSFAASASEAQRVATAVSELGRNIITYTPGGQIELEIRRGPPVRVRLIASDRGTGIADLEEVLAGRYRSKTGLGRGLQGIQRLMDEFRVHTSSHGTRIEAEVKFSC